MAPGPLAECVRFAEQASFLFTDCPASFLSSCTGFAIISTTYVSEDHEHMIFQLHGLHFTW